MVDICSYQIEVQDGIDEDIFNAAGPLEMHMLRKDNKATWLVIRCDQAGLVGIIRYLHQQRFVILSIRREG